MNLEENVKTDLAKAKTGKGPLPEVPDLGKCWGNVTDDGRLLVSPQWKGEGEVAPYHLIMGNDIEPIPVIEPGCVDAAEQRILDRRRRARHGHE